MEILYEKPKNTPADWIWTGKRTDKNGKRFWFDWREWIHAAEIKSPETIQLLPEVISDLIPKWTKDLENIKNKDKDYQIPIKNVSITFIYENKIYRLTPDAFSDDYDTRFYFENAHKIIEKDMQDAGCIFTEYSADLD